MIAIEVRTDTDILDAIGDTMRKSPGLMRTAYKRNIARLRPRILNELRKQPGKPKYPLAWTSERQRRFVMAKLRQEGNLPYRRTGKLLAAYDVEVIDDGQAGGILRVVNPTPSARFVVGDNAQRFHLATGWVQVAPVVAKYREIAEEELIQTWFTVSDPFAGVQR